MGLAVENSGVTPYCTRVRQKLVRLLGFRHVVAVTTDFSKAARLRFVAPVVATRCRNPLSQPVVATRCRNPKEIGDGK
jgi:hypothetical protein